MDRTVGSRGRGHASTSAGTRNNNNNNTTAAPSGARSRNKMVAAEEEPGSSSHPAVVFGNMVREMAEKRAVVIFTKSTCCISHSIKVLFVDMGVNVEEHELDKHMLGPELEWALKSMGCTPPVPAVFIAGKLVGSATHVFTLQVSGRLRKMLLDANALWV
ncbi:hypothetical protein DM860_012682 [Cuscuta australis]|uniref:Glutaredoxin domain-containing protein n=1 Tax=Cuscuta australis TaxID=267555 RepID=A0A328DHA5_9ASTE|nr:hypothetical protein DM860_012682 [Cuscuta australis]